MDGDRELRRAGGAAGIAGGAVDGGTSAARRVLTATGADGAAESRAIGGASPAHRSARGRSAIATTSASDARATVPRPRPPPEPRTRVGCDVQRRARRLDARSRSSRSPLVTRASIGPPAVHALVRDRVSRAGPPRGARPTGPTRRPGRSRTSGAGVLWRSPKNASHAPRTPPARHRSHSVRSRVRRAPGRFAAALSHAYAANVATLIADEPGEEPAGHQRAYSAPRVDGGPGRAGSAVPDEGRDVVEPARPARVGQLVGEADREHRVGERRDARRRRRRARRRGGRARRRCVATPPMPITGTSTACATSYTTRSATGRSAGPLIPP